MKLAEIRERLADINPEQLPSVEQARTQQLERGLTQAEQHLEQSAARSTQEAERPATPAPEPQQREEIHNHASAEATPSEPMLESNQQHNPEQAHNADPEPSARHRGNHPPDERTTTGREQLGAGARAGMMTAEWVSVTRSAHIRPLRS